MISDADVAGAYYCAAALVRARQRTGEPIPQWLRQHYDRLDAQVRVSRPGHESGSDTGQSEPDELISAREAAMIIGCSKRQVQRLASDLDGARIVDGRWLFRRDAVQDYAEGRNHA